MILDEAGWAVSADPWVAPDGTCWLYFAQFNEWTGWQPGEDGVWSRTDEEFRASYPEAPT